MKLNGNKFKTHPGLFLMALLFPFLLLAQPGAHGGRHQKIAELKKAFVQEELQITEQEGVLFWPVFQRYEEEKNRLRRAGHSKMARKDNFDELSEKKLNALIDEQLQLNAERVKLDQTYFKQFRAILPAEKVARLLFIDERFRQFIFKQAREREGGPGRK